MKTLIKITHIKCLILHLEINPLWDSSPILVSGRLGGLATKLIHLAGLTDNII